MKSPSLRTRVLLLANSETDKNKWIGALTELQRILKKNNLKDRAVRA